jgi:hypothetical protein
MTELGVNHLGQLRGAALPPRATPTGNALEGPLT